MSNLAVFEFNSKQVRIIEVDQEPWFVAKDICEILEIGNVSMACERLKEYEKQISAMLISGQNRDALLISESGLYRLVLTSRKPQAEPFQDWVVQEVLPSIRKHGAYSINRQPLPDDAKLVSELIDLIFVNVSIKPELISGLKLNAVQKVVPHLAPALEESRQLLIANTAQEFELLTPTEIGKRLGISGQAVNKLLCKKGFQVKNEERQSKKEPAYLPIGSGKEFSDLTLSTGTKGDSTSYQQLRWYSSILSQL